MDDLSSREKEVLVLAEKGLSDREIGDRLGIALSTVRNHIQSACRKFGAAHRFMCGALAERYGLFK